MLSVASTVVVTAFPLVLSRTPHQAVSWGGMLLIVSMLSFIAAFLLAGYVTVGYKAPPPGCSNIACIDGGISCTFNIMSWHNISDSNPESTVFVMDPNVAALNSIAAMSDSLGVCVTYNRSVSYGSYSTVYPWVPPATVLSQERRSASVAEQTLNAISQLYEDPLTQRQTVCMDYADLPRAIDPDVDPRSLEVNVSGDIPDLASYLVESQLTMFEFLPRADFQKLWPYSGLLQVCLPHSTDEHMQFDVLCELSYKLHNISQPGSGNLSVSKEGSYIKAASASDSDAVLFRVDATSQQVSTAVHALVGVFIMICLTIAGFLLKSKVNH